MNKVGTIIVIGITILLVLFALGESIGRIGDLQLAKENPTIFKLGSHDLHYANNSLIMYIHIISGSILLLTGSHQLIPYFRNKYIHIHRFIGSVFLVLSLIVSSSAIIIAVFLPFGNYIETVSNVVFGTFILFATIKAYTTIKAKNIVEHSYWVRRIFFLSLSIATVRLIISLGIIVMNKSIKEVMGVSFLLAFLLHFIVIELWIKNDRNSRKIK